MMTASEQASKENTSFWKYISEGKNPSVNVVLLEDSYAVLGCVVAGVCMGEKFNVFLFLKPKTFAKG